MFRQGLFFCLQTDYFTVLFEVQKFLKDSLTFNIQLYRRFPMLTFTIIWGVYILGLLVSFFVIIWPHRHADKIGVDRQENEKLITDGPYQFVRHPEYGGELLLCLAFIFLIISTSGLTVISGLITMSIFWYIWRIARKSLKEEIVLIEKFGQRADEYFASTRKRWIPFLI